MVSMAFFSKNVGISSRMTSTTYAMNFSVGHWICKLSTIPSLHWCQRITIQQGSMISGQYLS
uniref:Uncharacterized protein n=1 Tax=Arundo donax TaxID=35708 RepID=A0A0A9AER9_ARUDO